MKILGIDPGTAIVGYGVLEKDCNNQEFKVLGYGTITTSSSLKAEVRLKEIYNRINCLLKKYQPDVLAVENLYFFKNLKTVMPVSQAKGVIILAAAIKKVPICEITPLEVKMTVTGYGRANKKQTQEMVRKTLHIKEDLKPDDVADAIGVAICGYLKRTNEIRLKG